MLNTAAAMRITMITPIIIENWIASFLNLFLSILAVIGFEPTVSLTISKRLSLMSLIPSSRKALRSRLNVFALLSETGPVQKILLICFPESSDRQMK